jgi:hypothetical protein
MFWQALQWLLPGALMITLRQTMQAGHLNFLNRYLRQLWMLLAIIYTVVLLHSETVEKFAESLKGTYGGHPMKAYVIVGVLGAALFCGYWALIERIIPATASPKSDISPSAQKQEDRTAKEILPVKPMPQECKNLSDQEQKQRIQELFQKYIEREKGADRQIAKGNLKPAEDWINKKLKAQGCGFTAQLVIPPNQSPAGMVFEDNKEVYTEGIYVEGFETGMKFIHNGKVTIIDVRVIGPKQ